MRKCSWIKPKKFYTSSPLPVIRRFSLALFPLFSHLGPDGLGRFLALWSLILLIVKSYSRNEREEILHSEAISKLGSIKALLFQTVFSTQLILEWKVPQIESLQTIWNKETISCLFIFSLVPWRMCILHFFSPEARQVLLWRCECKNRDFAFRSLLWLSSLGHRILLDLLAFV